MSLTLLVLLGAPDAVSIFVYTSSTFHVHDVWKLRSSSCLSLITQHEVCSEYKPHLNRTGTQELSGNLNPVLTGSIAYILFTTLLWNNNRFTYILFYFIVAFFSLCGAATTRPEIREQVHKDTGHTFPAPAASSYVVSLSTLAIYISIH